MSSSSEATSSLSDATSSCTEATSSIDSGTTKLTIPRKETNLKFLLVGSSGVGKTSIVNSYVKGRFSHSYKNTIGIDFHRKLLEWSPNHDLRLNLWDAAGNDKLRCVSTLVYRKADGVAVVIDVTNPETLEQAKGWLDEVRAQNIREDGTELPVVLIANKAEPGPVVEDFPVTIKSITRFCKENKIPIWCYTSALLNVNLKRPFWHLVEQAMPLILKAEEPEEETIKLSSEHHSSLTQSVKEENKCCSIS